MRWLIAQFQHETNTFSNILPGRAEFAERELHVGEEMVRVHRGTRTVVGAFIDFVEKHNIEPVWVISAFATPAGRIKAPFYRWVMAQILQAVTPDIDGVLLSLHGAMVAEEIDDGEGTLLAALRERLGDDRPIATALDYHTNLSPAMVENADILVGYKTYPHVDLYETGMAAAELLLKRVKGEIRPVRAAEYPRIIAPLGNTSTLDEPMKSMMARAREMETEPGVLSVSVFGGFSWADIPDAGMSALVITDGGRDAPAVRARPVLPLEKGTVPDSGTVPIGARKAAAKRAKELGDSLWNTRRSFLATAVPIEDAVREAIEAKAGPIILADVADNPGGGGAGDGVEILRELLKQNAPDAVVGTIWDPAAVEACRKAGVGAEVALTIGGKTDGYHGKPVTLAAKVLRLGDGWWTSEGPMDTGLRSCMGPTAVIRSGGIDVILNSWRVQNLDLAILRSSGIEPTERKIIVVKSSIHYRGAYGPIAKRLIDVDAPGLVSPNLKRFPFRHVRRPIFPLDGMQRGGV